MEYAYQLSHKLRAGMLWHEEDRRFGYWTLPPDEVSAFHARAFAAMELLRQYAGRDSFWTLRAADVYDNDNDRRYNSLESRIYAIGELLEAWVWQVRAGVDELLGAHALDQVAVVSTDLMSQVRQLLERKDTHPAAAIVLCGAALESALRSAVEAKGITLELAAGEHPSLHTFTRALHKAKLLSTQDMKDITQIAGLRNAAAHGDFGDLSRERAGLMEQQVNILLRRLADLFGATSGPASEAGE